MGSENSKDSFFLHAVEESLATKFSNEISIGSLPCVFILGAPRTGSTLFYQFLINHFEFYYPTNLLNESFAEVPVIGAFFEQKLGTAAEVGYKSKFGKTEGPMGPSEGSKFFQRWYGGEHPSETHSSSLLPGLSEKIQRTFAALYGLTGAPLLFKNAWNCFRIESIASLFPLASFIWIRRDIRQAARSDLEARGKHGGYDVWNSATPKNYQEIKQRPYWEQVVEQQYEYGRRISSDFEMLSQKRIMTIWYEDICLNPINELSRLERFFSMAGVGAIKRGSNSDFSASVSERNLSKDHEGRLILAYLDSVKSGRLNSFLYKKSRP